MSNPIVGVDTLRAAKPRTIVWALMLLGISYALSAVHAEVVIGGEIWASWPPARVVVVQTGSWVFYAGLIYFISNRRNWARWTYLVLLAVRFANVVWYLPEDLRNSKLLVAVTGVSFLCQFVAVYLLFTDVGRRWFRAPDSISRSVQNLL